MGWTISRMGRIRTFIKKVENEINNKNSEKANLFFNEAMPEIHRWVSKGLMHKKNAARKLSRMSAKIKSIWKSLDFDPNLVQYRIGKIQILIPQITSHGDNAENRPVIKYCHWHLVK